MVLLGYAPFSLARVVVVVVRVLAVDVVVVPGGVVVVLLGFVPFSVARDDVVVRVRVLVVDVAVVNVVVVVPEPWAK